MEKVQVIERSRNWLRLDLKELIEYRDLLFLLVRRDFLAKYKQTILGPLWFVLQPLLTTVVFTIIFGKIVRIPTEGTPPLLFYLCGMLGWSYFAHCMNNTSTTFIANASLFGKVYFPRLIVPLSVVISNFFAFVLQFVVFMCFWIYYKLCTPAGELIRLNAVMFLLPFLVILTGGLGLAVGLWMSALTARYRDFVYLTGFLSQLWLYLTPVIYPLSAVPERWRWVSVLNPMTAVVETYRYTFLGTGNLRWDLLGISCLISTLLFISGLIIFNRVSKTCIDTV
jgi:lipopolysaccharide transport system permease protein